MSVYPHSRLFIGKTRAVCIVGPHIQVLDPISGDVLHSTFHLEENRKSMEASGPVRCAAVDREFRYLLTSGEDKQLKLWELDGLKLSSQRELPKKPTAVAFTPDAQTLLVSDKFGDIFSYPFTYVPLTVRQQRDALSSHENPSGGQLILGHASPLNAFLLTPDEKYIVTADRDEHIRVSWFPKGYIIERYCLGHLKFVSAIHIPRSDPKHLISGGGDPVLKIWDWMEGCLKHELQVLDVVEPWIAVRALKRKRGWGGDDDGEEAPEGGQGKRKRGKGKLKGKGKAKEQEDEVLGEHREGDEVQVNESEESKPEKILVIHKIDSLESGGSPYVIFSAVGTTALFAFPYRPDVASADVIHFNFGRPVLEFVVAEGGQIFVSLDGRWALDPHGVGENTSATGNSSMVRMVRVISGKLVEVPDAQRSLVDSLNSRSLLSATPDELKKVDLYGDLTLMPKYAAPPEEAEQMGPVVEGTSPASSSISAKPRELSKKELGRLKTREAVQAKLQERGLKRGETGDLVEPEPKRARSDAGGREDGEDAVMTES